MGTQGTGRKRSTKKDKSTAEEDALNLIAREAEARLAAKRAARAEAREIRMKELERQQKEEDSEKYSRSTRVHMLSDDDERISVGSRDSIRSDLDSVGAYSGVASSLHKKSKKKKKHKHKDRDRNSYDDDYSVVSGRTPRLCDDSLVSRPYRLDLQPASYASSDLYSLNGVSSSRIVGSTFNGYQSSLYEDSLCNGSHRVTSAASHPLEYTSYRSSSSRASSRASSACASPVVEDREFLEKGSRAASALTAATLTSLGGTSSRRGSGETALTVDAEGSIREIKEIHELKDQIQDAETKYTQNLKEVKEALAEVEEKFRKAMVSNAQLDNEKNNLMYQVDTLKDSLMELEEMLSESRRECEEKAKEHEREKHAHSLLQFQFNEMKETLKQSEELLNEIRQLRMKQDAFVREISDLQETVEWKDKKIGALERQKEYTDPIRIERDELREEVVNLKDILKKHGIILGPDLNINGNAGEEKDDGSPGAELASQSGHDCPTTLTEGNSMLGNAEETDLMGYKDEEADPEQQQKILEEEKENYLSSAKHCNVAEMSAIGLCSDQQSLEDQQACLPTEDVSGESINRNYLNVCPTTAANAFVVAHCDSKEIQTSHVESVPQMKGDEGESINHPELMETDAYSLDTHGDHVRETYYNQPEKELAHIEGSSLKCAELCPQQRDTRVAKENLAVQVIPAASNTDTSKPEYEEINKAERNKAEELPNESQTSTTSGKKKKKKKKAKKKGGTHDDKNQQQSGTDKANNKSAKESATKVNVDSCVADASKTKSDRVKYVDDEQKAEELNAAKPTEPDESCFHKEVLQDPVMEQVSSELCEGQSFTIKTLEEMVVTELPCLNIIRADQDKDLEEEEETVQIEQVEKMESYPTLESLNSKTNTTLNKEHDKLTSKAENVDAITSVTSPDPEASLLLSDVKKTGSIECPGKEGLSNSRREDIHTVPRTFENETKFLGEIKTDCIINNPKSSLETCNNKNSEIVVDDSGSTSSSAENKDNMLVSPPSPYKFTYGDLEPPAAIYSGSSGDLMARSDESPDEATEAVEAVTHDCDRMVDIAQEGITSQSCDYGKSEPRRDLAEVEGLNVDIKKPEGLSESSSSLQIGDSCVSVAKNTETVEIEKALQCMHLAYKSDAEETDGRGLSHTSLRPIESSVADCPVDLGSDSHENPEPLKGHEKCEGNNSCQHTQLDSDEEDAEAEEGQSFDFDDMDEEIAATSNVSNYPEQEEVEEGVEVASDEINSGSSAFCHSRIKDTESNQNTEKYQAEGNKENCTVDGDCQVDAVDNESVSLPQESQSSQPCESTSDEVKAACAEEQITTQEKICDELRQITEGEKALSFEELAVAPERFTQIVSSPVEEGLDAIELQSDLESPIIADQLVSKEAAQQTTEDAKKNGKKAKGKGKEDCKMS
ncbi:uncharacterized protein lrrfip1a isoform 3-T3 [Menidia menidia]